MKTTILMALMTFTSVFSTNASAVEVVTAVGVGAISVTVAGDSLAFTSNNSCPLKVVECKEASQVLKDTQDFSQSGKVSAFLAQKIKDAQSQDNTLSENEALDLLVVDAIETLN